jgi:NTE family protein
LVNPVPVSICRALGANVVVAVNLNGDLVGRHGVDYYERNANSETSAPPEFVTRLLGQVPAALREQVSTILPGLLSSAPASPGYFQVLMTCINIMQDQITRARLVGDPPHVMLVPRLSHVGWLEFNRAAETIAEGRSCAQQALPFLRRYL